MIRIASAALFSLGVVWALRTDGPLFPRDAWIWALPWLPLILLFVAFQRARREAPPRHRMYPTLIVLMLGLLVFLFSSGVLHRWFYFLHWVPQGPAVRSALVRFVLLTAVLTPLLAGRRWSPRWTGGILGVAVCAAIGLSLFRAVQTTHGAVLFRTDHPSFMFRLWEFGRAFPSLGGYNPWWNAGIEHFTGATSGIQGVGLLIYPLLRMAPVHEYYNAIIFLLFIVCTPLLAALSVRMVGGRVPAMATGALLALGVSQYFFMWMWHFGTIGAAFSAVMVAPAMAFAYRAAVLHRLGIATLAGLAGSAFLMAMWAPLGLLVGIGLTLSYVLMWRRWTLRTAGFLVAGAALALLAFFPWLRVILFPARAVVDYVSTSVHEPHAWTAVLASGGRRLLAHFQEAHPVLLFLGLGGLLVALPRSFRRGYLPTTLLLAAVCGWYLEWKPFSQLERVSIPLLFALLVPAALVTGRILNDRSAWSAPIRATLIVLLLLGGYNVSHIYANRGPARAETMPAFVLELAGWVRAEVPENGRVLFAGRNARTYGGGYLAYLPVLAGRQMMADDYYGFPRGTIEFNYPPQKYRATMESFMSFMHAYNVTHVITRNDQFREFFAQHPDDLEPVRSFAFLDQNITAYRLHRREPLLPEAGQVTADVNRIVVDFDSPAEEVILPYNWRDGLFCRTPGAQIMPYAYDENLRLIAVRPGGATRVEIGYHMPWGPVQPNFDGHFHH